MATKSNYTSDLRPFNIVIFGGNGDLSKRKIIPALFHRYADGQLDFDFEVICTARAKLDRTLFLKEVEGFIDSKDTKKIADFFKHLIILEIPKNTLEAYAPLKTRLEKTAKRQRIFYFSVPSGAFSEICNMLKGSGLVTNTSKVVLEKPLGHDLESSKQINEIISQAFTEPQIFRIDHYLGKETVQNIMVLRFANHLFERAWNADNIENIQITVAESLGVEKRSGYYDKTGALLDMVQNHLLQLLCLVTMEPPSNLNPDAVRNEKLKVLESLRPFTKESIRKNVVRGQYTRGSVDDQKLNSYREDIDAYDSETETFVAIKAYIDNWRWKNTPIYLRTGKRMKKRYSDIVINFKELPHNIFQDSKQPLRNKLIIRLQPEERIELVQLSKVPGPGGYRFKPISLKLDFIDSFDSRMPEAYERLIVDVIRGNQTLFMRYDELAAAWEWIESINTHWRSQVPLSLYESGTWGPGDQILEKDTKWKTN
ncbi:glucose-6-phosphate dehydrogenase [Crocinitomicaceae bacterium]|jgi:glucose-6-phosphate 1-dehydrogenase|nr:glucose-6-phosphate dehydrogenase [Crocinitomicaceae bacterium]MDG1035908.1 glucose-6-phosphate dehydrogenase [Crocinitomicaceae bacterium]